MSAVRPLIDVRLRALPAGPPVPPRSAPSEGERAELLRAFLASREARRLPDPDLAAEIVELAIDFAADDVDGRPLRWSPVVVELFCAHHLARQVIAHPSFFSAVPAVLDAWVRYAGRRRGIPAAAIEAAAEAVDDWSGEMVAAATERHEQRSPAERLGVELMVQGRLGATLVSGTATPELPRAPLKLVAHDACRARAGDGRQRMLAAS